MEINKANILIQTKYNLLRVKLLKLVVIYKRLAENYQKYNLHITRGMELIQSHKFIFHESNFYVLRQGEVFPKLSTNSSGAKKSVLYVISQTDVFKMKAIKLIIKSLFDYDKTLKDHVRFLKQKICSVIQSIIDFKQIYDYLLNIVQSNGDEYSRNLDSVFEEFE